MAHISSLRNDGRRYPFGHIECPRACYRRVIGNHLFADKVARRCWTHKETDNNFIRPA